MTGQTLIIRGIRARDEAHRLVTRAPEGAVLNIREATRTNEQNAKLHAMLSDVARAKPQGRKLSVDVWKALVLAALGHKVHFEPALDGNGVVPIGMRSSRLTKSQMSDMIEWLYAFGAEHNIQWSEPNGGSSNACS